MTGNEIREAFLRYFEERGHERVAACSLVPQGDATLLFVNAGMVPFKRVFQGEETRPYRRAVSAQKCMRVSGKHNDLEEVGRSPSHQTLFEMLGNFSFGDYFKREAIEYGWDFLTRVAKLAPERLAVSVHRDDEQAYRLWREHVGIDPRRIFRLGDDENFWQMGDTGPCGPCSEIHLITDPSAFDAGGDPSGPGFLELWNLVFMQFEQAADGSRRPLPEPSIDTGMGLERLTRVLQGVQSNYDTDLFRPVIDRAVGICGKRYGASPESDVSLRVVADHARACAFLVGDGVLPSNEGRGYVLRRVLRRAARHGVLLGIEEPCLYDVVQSVIDEMGGAYPELCERRPFIAETIRKEEERFLKTLGRGLELLAEEVRRTRSQKHSLLAGDVVFKLYDTYGFPADLTEDILRGHGLAYDRGEFDRCMREQAQRARAAWKGTGAAIPPEVYGAIGARIRSEFVGYGTLEVTSEIAALVRDGSEVEQAGEGDRVEVIVARTPFYAEGGGQVGDAGTIATASARIEIDDTQRPVDGVIVHVGRVVLGTARVGDHAQLVVDAELRAATVRNHSATHLLHWALRRVLGPQVSQAGSLVGPHRLRFDFTWDEPLTDEQIRQIEDLVNGLILENLTAEVDSRSYKEAIAAGAVAIFDEKYGDRVRVVRFGPSMELCGGTHARATGDIGSLRILSQTAIGAGVRRLEAQTGLGALDHARSEAAVLRNLSRVLRVPLEEVGSRIQKLLDRQKELERELEATRARMRSGGGSDPMQQIHEVSGVRYVAAAVEDASPKELRTMVDELKQRIGSGIVLLASRDEGKVALALGVTADLTSRFPAGRLIKGLAECVGGSGGGRPDFAQAGGSQPENLSRALDLLAPLLAGEEG